MKTKIFYLIMVITVMQTNVLYGQQGARISGVATDDPRLRPEQDGGNGGGGPNDPPLPTPEEICDGYISASVTLYVDKSTGSDSDDGLSWEKAKKTLGAALNLANACQKVTRINVAKGVYKSILTATEENRDRTFLITRGGYSIYGGYPPGEDLVKVRDYINNPTILDGEIEEGYESYHVLLIVTGTSGTVTIDGFQIKNGFADGTGSVTLEEPVAVSINRNDGGGLYIKESGTVKLKNCAIYHNVANNGSGSNGGGIFNNNSGLELTNCVLTDNIAATNGGGLYNVNTGSTTIRHSTFYNNQHFATNGGGAVYNQSASYISVFNSILWGNSSSIEGTGGRDIRYSILQENYAGIGQMVVDPQFFNPVNPAGADGKWFTSDDGLALRACSPGINRGNDALTIGSEDLTGNPRIYNEIVDLGPYEYQISQPPVSANVLAESFDISITNVYGGITNITKDCKTIVTLTPNGANALSGPMEATVYLQAGAPEYDGKPYVARHYDITPYSNALTATARVTLYFIQGDFDRYNTAVGPRAPHLPESSADDSRKRNLRINQFHSGPDNIIGLLPPPLKAPEDYSGGFTLLNPDDADITWHTGRGGSEGYWSVSFNVSGFSGFFVTAGESGALPVTLVSFDAKLENNSVQLNWQTSRETNSSHFVVQKSFDAKNFENIAQIQSAGNSANPTTYHYSDDLSEVDLKDENVYYRLQEFDLDGTYAFSRMASVKVSLQSDTDQVLLMGNPVENKATVLFSTSPCDEVSIRVLDMKGRQVLTKKFAKTCLNTLSLPTTSLPGGMYLLEVLWKQNRKTLKIVKL